MPRLGRRPLLQATAGLLATAGTAQAAALAPLLRVGMNSDIRGTNPFGTRDQNTDAVLQHAVEGLVAFRENAEIGPMLAQGWDVASDGRSYRFHLRPGVRFHNGAVLAAENVVEAWRRLLDPAGQWRGRPDFTGPALRVTDIAAPDPATVVFTLDQPSALFLPNMARPDYGQSAILHRESWDEHGAWRQPIGTGPFRLGEWKPGQSTELLRFAEYAALPGPRDGNGGGKHALVERVLIRVVPDANAAMAGLQSGALDIAWPLSPEVAAQVKDDRRVALDTTPILDMYAMLFQTGDKLLSDVRIRRAIAMALDPVDLTDGATHGIARPNSSIVAATSPFHTAVQAEAWPNDPAAAAALLKQAGYRGEPITVVANRQYPEMYQVAVLAQAMAQAAGVNLQITLTDWATQLDRYTRGEYQAMAFGYSARMDPSQMFDTVMGPKAREPRKVWDDPEAQALLVQSGRTLDHAARQAAFDALHRRMVAQVPLIPLFNMTMVSAARPGVVGYKGWPGANARFWDVSPA